MNGLCLSPTSGKPQPTTSQTKKPVTPEMKRTRSQGTRYKLQKMHTIQSMASTEDNTFNMNISLGSGGFTQIIFICYIKSYVAKLTFLACNL